MEKLTLAATLLLLGSGCLLATDEVGDWTALADAGVSAPDAGEADAGVDPSAELFSCDTAPPCGDVVWCWQDARAGHGRLNAIWASGTTAWIAGEQGVLLRYDGERFTKVDSGTTETLRAIAGSSSNDVWVAGTAGKLLHWDGAKWSPEDVPTGVELLALHTPAPGTLWAGGRKANRGVVLRGEGGAWKQALELDAPVTAIEGAGGKVLIASETGETHSIDGKDVNFDGKRSVPLRALWTVSDSLVFGAGGGTTSAGEQQSLIARWTGRHWSEDLHGVGEFLAGLHGSSTSDGWAVGTSGTVLHYDGTRWSTVQTGISADLQDVWSFGPEHAIAVGAGGAIGRFARIACNP